MFYKYLKKYYSFRLNKILCHKLAFKYCTFVQNLNLKLWEQLS